MTPQDPLASTIEILNDCFNPRAEEHSSLATQSYFAGRQGSIVTELRRYSHHLIQGRMGTGKTMVLKFLSISCQLYDSSQIQKLKHVGIYIGLSPAWLHPLRLEDNDDAARIQLFDAWFCLFAVECVLRELRDLPEPLGSTIRTAETYSKLGKLLQVADISDESTLLNFLEDERAEIETYFGSTNLPDNAQQLLARNSRRKIRPFFDRLSESLIQIFRTVLDTQAKTFYLLDQFEHCSPKQQEIISRLLATAGSNAPFFAKIGCRPHKSISFRSIAPQDYRVVQLEMSPDSAEYTKFAREVISLRIASVARQLKTIEAPAEYFTLFSNVEALLGNHSFENQWAEFSRKMPHSVSSRPASSPEITAFRALTINKLPRRFGGVATIRRLSGGFVRTLLSLVYQIIRFALEQYHHRTLRSRKVPLDIQDKAVRAEVQNELGARLRAILSSSTSDSTLPPISESRKEQTEALLRRLVRSFHKELISDRNDPSLLTFQLPFNLTDPEYIELFGILMLLRDLGYLSGEFSTDRPVLTISPIVAPWLENDQNEIPPISTGVLRLNQREALNLARPFLQQGPAIRHTIKVFYASGWRTELELRLLTLFTGQIEGVRDFANNQGLAFSFGSDPTGANHALFEQLYELINASNFLIAEVSSLNENVAFEIGLARALRKRTYHLVNVEIFKNNLLDRSKRFENFIMGHQFFKYSLLSPNEPDPKSLEAALADIVTHHSSRLQKKRQQKTMLRESGQYTVKPYFHLESSSPAAPWYGDLLKLSRQLRREPLNPGTPNRRRSQFDHYADAIDRSTHIIVDISRKDPFACLLYGYAIGTDRQVLPIWDAKSSGPITDIRGLPDGGGYTSRDHLFEGIITPWLSGEDV